MKRRLLVICASLLLVVGLYVTNTTATFAAVSPSQNTSHMTAQQLANGINLLKPHIHFNAQRIASLDVSNASSVGLDEQTFALFEQGVQQYNTNLSKGLIKTSPISINVQTKTPPSSVRPDGCAGYSWFSASYGYWSLYLNECQTVQLEAELYITAGVVGIIGILIGFVPVIGQIVGGAFDIASYLIAIGATAILYTDAGDGFNGVYLDGGYSNYGVTIYDFGAQ